MHEWNAATAEILAGKPVFETAITYGYGSADAFPRAFKASHGITPTQARHSGSTLRLQSQLKIHLTIEGSSNVPYSVVDQEAFQLVGYNIPVPVIHLAKTTPSSSLIGASPPNRFKDVKHHLLMLNLAARSVPRNS